MSVVVGRLSKENEMVEALLIIDGDDYNTTSLVF
jgi:hypothetical protein